MAKNKVFDSKALKGNIVDLKDRIMELEENLREDVKEKAINAEKKVEKRIEEHPMQSVGIAFGAGVAIGALALALMKRR